MKKLLGVLLAVILHSPTFLDAHALAKREHPLPTDTREPIVKLPIGLENLWPREDGQARYLQDYVKTTNEHPRSRLLSSLIDDSEGLGKPQHSEIQPRPQSQPQKSIPQVEQQQEEDHVEQYEKDGERQQDLGEREEYDDQSGEQSKWEQQEDSDNFEEEYVKRQEEKYKKPEVHLFGPPGLPQRRNVEELQHQNPHTVQSEARDLRKTRPDQPNAKMTHNDPQISRVERPATIHFSYIHPERWSLDSPECSGRLQSPVNLDSDKLVSLDVPSSLIWTGYWNQPRNLTITDNGHSVELSGTWDKKTAPFISGGPLEGDYLFAQLHFHWGPKDSVGSEHTINNNSFPMEMHMVHYKRDYETLSSALNHDDGLAVVAFLFEISETPNFGINFLADSLSKIQNKPSVPFPVKPYPLAFLHFIFQSDYASYIGSLTTPPCREIVTWLVSSRPLTISRKQHARYNFMNNSETARRREVQWKLATPYGRQFVFYPKLTLMSYEHPQHSHRMTTAATLSMESFRKISNRWPEKENYRPQQALNGRNLYYVAH